MSSTPFAAEEFDAIFQVAAAVQPTSAWDPRPSFDRFMHLDLQPYSPLARLVESSNLRAGLPPVFLSLKVSDALRARIEAAGMIYGTKEPGQHYFLQVFGRHDEPVARCRLGYQVILGSREIPPLTEDQQLTLANRVIEAVNVLRVQHRQAPAPLKTQEDFARIRAAMAASEQQRTTAALQPEQPEQRVQTPPPAAPLPQADSATLTLKLSDELPDDPAEREILMQMRSLLVTAGSLRVRLPAEQLSRYKEIRARMLNAGSKYGSDRTGSYFDFPPGTDLEAVMGTLLNGDTVNLRKETQFFPTPKAEARDLCSILGDLQGKRVLEPEAGQAALADEARASGAEVVTIENFEPNLNVLRQKGYNPIDADFLTVKPEDLGELFDAVLMNPPFTKGQDVKHIKHALSFLTSTGSLAAIASAGIEHNSSKAYAQMRTILETASETPTPIEAGAFSESGTQVRTVKFSIYMPELLDNLEQKGMDGSELGLDLSRQWAHRESLRQGNTPRDRG